MRIQRRNLASPMATAPNVLQINQDEDEYINTEDATSLTLLVECISVVNPSGGGLTLQFMSSLTKDSWAQVPLVTIPNLAPGLARIYQSVLGAGSVAPTGSWLGWQFLATGASPSGTYGASFRYQVGLCRTRDFSPTLVQGCVGWYRGDLGLGLSGTTVLNWADQSGTGIMLAPSSSNPAYAATAIAGHAAVQFSGTAGQALTSALGPTIAQANSVFVVFQSLNASPASNAVILDGATGAAFQQIAQATGSATSMALDAGAAQSATVSSVFNNPTVVQVDWVGASTVVYQNGSAIAPSGNPGAQSLAFGAIGGPSGSGLGSTFNGYVAEVVLYNRVVTAAERVLLTRYLGKRYGVNVP